MNRILGVLLMIVLFGSSRIIGAQPLNYSIIPQPIQVEAGQGSFSINSNTKVIVASENAQVGNYLAGLFEPAMGYRLEVFKPDYPITQANTITLRLTGNKARYGEEGYDLIVSGDRIVIDSYMPAGAFYAVQTLRQLLPVEIESSALVDDVEWSVPCVNIFDKPCFGWRGMLLDVSRHFHPKDFIKRYIDLLAKNKMNIFHWHLVDSQGWRIEIKKYPKLTEVGAWRADRTNVVWGDRKPEQPGEERTYGGFYSQDDIREIVEYAEKRFVTIVPEIEMPGHTMAALVAYPEYSCEGGPFVMPTGPVDAYYHNYCAGNDEVFNFIEDVLTEVMDLFPSEFIHIGGDEVDKSAWKKCDKCQARIKNEGLKNEEELQSYFIKRIEKFLLSNNKRLLGWDEILEGGLAPSATVMSWRGMAGGIAAAKANHDVVMAPNSYVYFDLYQGDVELEPPAYSRCYLKTTYSFNPISPAFDQEQAKHVLGGQGCLWGEFITTGEHAEYMTFPRLFALSEAVWSPNNLRDWERFIDRMEKAFKRLDAAGVKYAKSAYDVRVDAEVDLADRTISVALKNELGRGRIRYTLDGSEPGLDSPVYEAPLQLSQTVTVKAGTFKDGQLFSRVSERRFSINKATAKPVRVKNPCSPKYAGGGETGLVDCLRGSGDFQDGRWQGYLGSDFEAVVDLGEIMDICRVSTGYLHNTNSWIFLPAAVTYAVSIDGNDFKTIAVLENEKTDPAMGIQIKDFSQEFINIKGRYVKIIAKNIGKCPEGHRGQGQAAWLFIDEIIVE